MIWNMLKTRIFRIDPYQRGFRNVIRTSFDCWITQTPSARRRFRFDKEMKFK